MTDPVQFHHRIHFEPGQRNREQDAIAREEPLQIRLRWYGSSQQQWQEQILSITMRTPGNDAALATGLLLAEGVLASASAIERFSYEENHASKTDPNQLLLTLQPGIEPQLPEALTRFTTYSSCGLCGKASLQALELKSPPAMPHEQHWLKTERVYRLTASLRQQQPLFQQTGGVHAAGLFDALGQLVAIAEDVGRHNALDKLLGAAALRHTATPAQSPPDRDRQLILVSGRASFELVQKVVMAGYPVLAAVGAPSSLALSAAQRFNLTLLGFVSEQHFNCYHGAWRLQPAAN